MRACRGGWQEAGRPFVLALALFLAGCGGDDTPAGPIFPDNGSTGWSAPELVSNLRDNSIEMPELKVALTSPGVGFVAWTERVPGTLCAKTWVNRNAAGAWGTPTQIGIEQARSPMVAANGNGDAVLVWIEHAFPTQPCAGTVLTPQLSLYASRYSAASNTWTAPAHIGSDVFSPSMVFDAFGRATAVWVQIPGPTPSGLATVMWSRFDGTSWSAPAALSDGTRDASAPVMAQDGSGNVLVLWPQQTNLPASGLPALPNIWFARFNGAGGTWSTPVKIGNLDVTGTGSDSAADARIAANALGGAVAVWKETRSSVASIVSARFSAGTWTSPVFIENNAQPADRPEVAIDNNGNAQAVWTQKIDGLQAEVSGFTARFDPAGGTWGAPQLFEQSTVGVFAPLVGMDDTGRALIVWEETNTGVGPIHAIHFTPATGFGTVTDFSADGKGLAVNGAGTALLGLNIFSGNPSISASFFRP